MQKRRIIARPPYKTFPDEEDGGVAIIRNYPSDLTDGQWRKIHGLLPKAAKRGRKPLAPHGSQRYSVCGANVQDQEGAKRVFQHLVAEFGRLQVVFGDSAYGRSGLPQWVLEHGKLIPQTVLRPVGVKGFVVLPKRWIVERTFGWLGRCRRLSKDYERNPASSEAMVHLAMIHLMSRRLAAGEK